VNERVTRERPSQPSRPRVMRWRSRGRQRSVDRGTRRPAIELRNQVVRGADAVVRSGRPYRGRRSRRAGLGPRAVVDPVHAWKLLAREPGDPSLIHPLGGSPGEGCKPYVQDARGWEVGRSRTTWEAGEQRQEAGGARGGKGIGQGERAAWGHAPDTEPGWRVVPGVARA
jgi:hypothetical protein